MSPQTIFLAGVITALLLLTGMLIRIYNSLVKKRILTEEAASGIGACLQQRYDLIPNLVETVKGYAEHEQTTLNEVTRWRNAGMAASSVVEQSDATKGLNQALNNMMAVAEAYPDLKADGHFRELMTELADVEDKINDARRYYNGTVRDYNQAVAVFPNNLIAAPLGFKAAAFFAEDTEARTAPRVQFQS